MKKLSLKSVKEFLSRDEMRVISGGSGTCFSGCWTHDDCWGWECQHCYQPINGGGPGACGS